MTQAEAIVASGAVTDAFLPLVVSLGSIGCLILGVIVLVKTLKY